MHGDVQVAALRGYMQMTRMGGALPRIENRQVRIRRPVRLERDPDALIRPRQNLAVTRRIQPQCNWTVACSPPDASLTRRRYPAGRERKIRSLGEPDPRRSPARARARAAAPHNAAGLLRATGADRKPLLPLPVTARLVRNSARHSRDGLAGISPTLTLRLPPG